MKKKILSLVLLLIMLTSCSSFDKYFSNEDSTNVYEFDDTDDSAEVNSNHADTRSKYVVNIKTKTYHISSCIYAEKLSDENKEYFDNRQFLNQRGYKSCKKCIK